MFNDFYSYFIAGILFLKGEQIYTVSKQFIQTATYFHLTFLWGTGYSYPPLLAQVFSLGSFIPPHVAAIGFFLIQVILYFLLLIHIRKTNNIFHNPFIFLFCVFFGPVYGSLLAGQVNIIILWCLYVYVYSRNTFMQMLLLSTAGWIKVYPFLFLIREVLQKKWKRIAIFTVCFISLFFLQAVPQKGEYITFYIQHVLPSLQNEFDPYITNQSINGFVSRLVTPHQSQYGSLLLSSILLLVTLAITFTSRKNKKLYEQISLLWIMSALLIGGKNSFWNMAPSLFTYLYLFKHMSSRNKIFQLMFVFSCIVSIVFPLYIGLYGLLKVPLVLHFLMSSLGFFSMLILYILLIFEIIDRKRRSYE